MGSDKGKKEEAAPVSEETTELHAYLDRIEALKAEVSGLREEMKGMERYTPVLQSYIPSPPVQRGKDELYDRACSNDSTTIGAWAQMWLDHIEQNSKKYDFKQQDAMKAFGKFATRPAICAGSGPSLRKNAHLLADKKYIGDVPIVSCLHNFGYFTDLGVDVQYYVNLDAGDITIGEMSQGGGQKEQYYWDRTKGKTLIAVVHSNPRLLEKWQGDILFFNAVVNDPEYAKKMESLIDLRTIFNVGGNTLGAAMYFARAILGCPTIALVGADMCFSRDKKFHPFDSPYDNQFAGVIPWTNIYGDRVWTWRSYLNFKFWFDFIACGGRGNNPIALYNCTEGGILGAYPEGNIQQINQRTLEEFLRMVNLYNKLPEAMQDHKYALLF